MSVLTDTGKAVKVVVGAGTPTTAQVAEMEEGVIVLDLDGRVLTKDVLGQLRLIAETNNNIESGSNANGSWVKYPDGTLLQFGKRGTPIYVSSGAVITLPVSFIDTGYALTVSSSIFSSAGDSISVYEQAIWDASSFLIKGIATSYDMGIGGGIYTFDFIAIGRWE